MGKKENNSKNGGAAETWRRRKVGFNAEPVRKQMQKVWRIACLKERAANERLTETNKAEMSRLMPLGV